MDKKAGENLYEIIEIKRTELNELIEQTYLRTSKMCSSEVIEKSEELDVLLVQLYRLGFTEN